MKFWDAIHDDKQRARLWRRFPDIRPPDHRLDNIEPASVIVQIMKEPPVGDTATIGRTPVKKG